MLRCSFFTWCELWFKATWEITKYLIGVKHICSKADSMGSILYAQSSQATIQFYLYGWLIKSPCTYILAKYSWRLHRSQQGCDTQSAGMYLSLNLIALQIHYGIDQFMMAQQNWWNYWFWYQHHHWFLSYFGSDPIGEIYKHQLLLISTSSWLTQYVLLYIVRQRKSSIGRATEICIVVRYWIASLNSCYFIILSTHSGTGAYKQIRTSTHV